MTPSKNSIVRALASPNRKIAAMKDASASPAANKAMNMNSLQSPTPLRSSSKIAAMKEKVKRPSDIRRQLYGQLLSPTPRKQRKTQSGDSDATPTAKTNNDNDDDAMLQLYQSLQRDIMVQSQLRKACREMAGLPPNEEQDEPSIPMMDSFKGDSNIKAEIKRLQRILDRIRMEIKICENMGIV